MKQQVPGWVIGLLIVGLVGILICPPWEYQPLSLKEGGTAGFTGWHPWWYQTPPLANDSEGGTHQKWNVKTSYIVVEILILGAVVFGLGFILGRNKSQVPAPEPPAGEAPPNAQ